MTTTSPVSASSSPRFRQAAALLFRLVLGLSIGFFAHYLLYRLALPVQPFIYVAF